jgi:glycosyltransferase involved in cell wall biosynthesis
VVARKGIETVVEVAKLLHRRGEVVTIRVVGGPSLWSDYTSLLDDLPADTAEYVGAVDPAEVPAQIAASDLLLAPSRYEPFALTVAEALASGLPVIGTSEVGAIEGVARSVVTEVAPGDAGAMAAAILTMIERLRTDPVGVRATARAEAQRLFAPQVVCEQVSRALVALVDGVERDGHAAADDPVRAST